MDTFFKQSTCDRCGGSLAEGRIMSVFNHQCLCLKCKAEEVKRGDYPLASMMEREAVKHGVRDFPGIGLGECFTDALRTILPIQQRKFVESLLNSDSEDTRQEGQGVLASAESQARTFETMPKTYEQGCKGDKAVAYLHYFVPYGKGDWWITERDIGKRQIQAFGLVNLFDVELGYISLEELQVSPYVELDFYWQPTTLAEIRESIGDA